MPPGPGQVPIELFEYVIVFGGITPGSFSETGTGISHTEASD
ncbi:hypothetical protein WM42_2516 [Corynebacterium simulans]|nr:hypothetical protein WM42_2516 [Corynebacterium simulans]